MSEKIDKALSENFSDLPNAKEMYREFKEKSKIEEMELEGYVIKKLMTGMSKSSVVKELNEKHPDVGFTNHDMDKFLERNNQIVKELEKDKNILARRHKAAKVEVEERLSNIISFTENLVKKYDQSDDPQSTVAALNSLNKSIMNYAKLAGYLDENENDNNNNKTVIQVVSDKHDKLSKRAHEADFKMVE